MSNSKKNTFLITTPDHDDTTAYCSAWSKEVIDLAENKGFTVINLSNKKATKKELEKRLSKHKPEFIMFNGHGDDKSIGGYDDEILVTAGENEYLLKGRIVYALSCYSLYTLGKTADEKGVKAYIGYRFPFAFYLDPSYSTTPLKDKVAKYFFDASNRIPKTIIKGANVGEAVKRSHEKIDEAIDFWKVQDTPDAEWVLAALYTNKMGLGLEGNERATIQ